jgi:hypothetical protein
MKKCLLHIQDSTYASTKQSLTQSYRMVEVYRKSVKSPMLKSTLAFVRCLSSLRLEIKL